MYDILPEPLIKTIRDRYLAGVADAEAGFEFSSDDEDSLTGALGQSISTIMPQIFETDGRAYVWQITYRKIRGRGPGAPEKRLGADGIFQISVSDATGAKLREKGLPFQCKKGWQGRDPKLAKQAADMLQTAGDGIVIDYREDGYRSCTAERVVSAGGSRAKVDAEGGMQALGQILGNDFLECKEGKIGLSYDPVGEDFDTADTLHLVSTVVNELPR